MLRRYTLKQFWSYNMTELLIINHSIYKDWLYQFDTAKDRALATQLFHKLKFVSEREFESEIEETLINLQNKLGDTIAVYPVIPKIPTNIVGHDQYTGGIPEITASGKIPRDAGRRRQYGSEDKVGHVLAKLQNRFRRPNGGSVIQCTPTITQIKSDKIKHIVFVDDICGSGDRISDYWKNTVSKSIKSLLSFKKIELWMIFYAITESGKQKIEKMIPNFPVKTHLITLLPKYNLNHLLGTDLKELSKVYSKTIKMKNHSLGYKNSGGLVVFEHGCPNNLPVIFWAKNKNWKGLFPNCSIPTEFRSYFDNENIVQPLEELWSGNQKKLALKLMENIEVKKLSIDEILVVTMIALLLKGVDNSKIGEYLLVSEKKYRQIIELAEEYYLYKNNKVTSFGKEFLKRYRNSYQYSKKKPKLEKLLHKYYPNQCEGDVLFSGKSSEVMGG